MIKRVHVPHVKMRCYATSRLDVRCSVFDVQYRVPDPFPTQDLQAASGAVGPPETSKSDQTWRDPDWDREVRKAGNLSATSSYLGRRALDLFPMQDLQAASGAVGPPAASKSDQTWRDPDWDREVRKAGDLAATCSYLGRRALDPFPTQDLQRPPEALQRLPASGLQSRRPSSRASKSDQTWRDPDWDREVRKAGNLAN